MICPNCGLSTTIIRAGIRKNESGPKQIFRCKKCNRKFTTIDIAYKKKFPQRIIVFAMKKHREGMKVREIHQEIQRFYKTPVSLPTLYNWINTGVTGSSKAIIGKEFREPDDSRRLTQKK